MRRRPASPNGPRAAAIKRLQARGLVRTPADPGSRNSQLTRRGRRLIEAAFEQHAREMEESMAVLNPAERRDLFRLLARAVANFPSTQQADDTIEAFDSDRPRRVIRLSSPAAL